MFGRVSSYTCKAVIRRCAPRGRGTAVGRATATCKELQPSWAPPGHHFSGHAEPGEGRVGWGTWATFPKKVHSHVFTTAS